MKKQFLVSIITLLAVVSAATAQTNQYPGVTGTIERDGYTYKYRNDIIAGGDATSRIEIYNEDNSYLDVKWAYADGSEMPFEVWDGKVPDIKGSSQTIRETLDMVNNLFTTQQKTMLTGKSLFISLRINPSTGRVADVYFSFFRRDPFMYIPVETYRSIELAIKQNLTVTVTPEGKKLTYIKIFWSQKF